MRAGVPVLVFVCLSVLAADARADDWSTPGTQTTAEFDATVDAVTRRADPGGVPAQRCCPSACGPRCNVRGFVDSPTYFLTGFDINRRRLSWCRPADQERIRKYVRWVQRMTPASWAVTGGLAAGGIAVLGSADIDTIEEIGDVTQLALPIGAYLTTFIANDPVGRQQFLKSLLVSQAVVRAGKLAFDEWRPNSSNAESFPSGHTSAAFLGAAFFYERYGPVYGVPAYAIATYTGLSRVWAEKHFADDVLAGASISMLSVWLFTSPKGAECLDTDWRSKCPTWRFEYEVGALWQTSNEFRAPKQGGTQLDFAEFDSISNPSIVNRASFEYFAGRHELMGRIAPGEIQDFATFTSPVRFGDKIFAPGVETRTRYLAYDYRLRYRYELVGRGPWHVKIGATASLVDFTAELDDGQQRESINDVSFLPLVHAHAGYDISRRWRVFLEADGISLGDEWAVDGVGSIRYRFNRWWEIGLGYRFWLYDIESDEFVNQGDAQTVVVQIAYQR